jgi:hypothetical protein
VTQNISAIATATSGSLCPIGTCPLVTGAVADGVTQVVIVVLATLPGDPVQITLTNENGDQDAVGDGGLFPLGSFVAGNGASTLTVPAQGGAGTPLAVVIWRAPLDYNRGSQYPADATTVQRNLTLKVQLPGADGAALNLSQTLTVVRPPVVLIHGIWSSGQGTFGGFYPANAQNLSLWNLMNPQKNEIDYSAPVPVTATNPPYFLPLTQVGGNALGFSYNASNVLLQSMSLIANYAYSNNVAAVQADVVGHSMGGDIARTMPAVSFFAGNNNYGMGYVHKLITIGTPHNGTQVAVDLLPQGTLLGSVDPNNCVRKSLEEFNYVSLQTATVNGVTVNGAIGDLQQGVSGSVPFPTAYIGGTTESQNLSQLGSRFSKSATLYRICGTLGGEPLALRFTPAGWNQEFSGDPNNDGLVLLTSQLNGKPSTLIYPGMIHSPGLEVLNFSPPSEVDSASGIPDEVVNLLNESVSGTDFFTNQ